MLLAFCLESHREHNSATRLIQMHKSDMPTVCSKSFHNSLYSCKPGLIGYYLETDFIWLPYECQIQNDHVMWTLRGDSLWISHIKSVSVQERKMQRTREEAEWRRNLKPQMRQMRLGTLSEEAGKKKWVRGEMSVKEKEGESLAERENDWKWINRGWEGKMVRQKKRGGGSEWVSGRWAGRYKEREGVI